MTRPSLQVDHLSLLGKLRWAGVGLATAEVIYLVGWMGVDLGLLDITAFGHAPDKAVSGLRNLMDGMLWTASLGIVGGLLAAFGADVIDAVAGRPVSRKCGQAFARSLVVRNQIR